MAMKKILPGLDLLTKKIVKDSHIKDVELLRDRGPDIPAKSGLSFMVMITTDFTKALLDRVKKEFSRMESDSELQRETRAYHTESKRAYRKKV